MIAATIIGILATVAFALCAFFLARRQADDGLMDQMPALKLPVAIMPITLPSVAKAMDEAREWWNACLGQAVIVAADKPTFETCVFVETTYADDFFARTQFIADKLAVLMLVNMREADRYPQLLPRALAHELGHVLGLADDDDPASVMYHKASTGNYHLTARDRALVEARV